MTLVEYQLRMEAYQLKKVERQDEIAMQSWMNQVVKATTGKKHPKPKFKKFEDFFDRQGSINQVREAFEPDYEISQMSPRELKKKQQDLFAKRLIEFNRLRKQGKIIPLNQRKKGGT